MGSYPIATTEGSGPGGVPRVVVRFDQVDLLSATFKEVEQNGAFCVHVRHSAPTSLVVWVRFRAHKRAEEFPADILTWSRGLAVLKPKIELSAFKSLSAALAKALRRRSQPGVGERQPTSGDVPAVESAGRPPAGRPDQPTDPSGPPATRPTEIGESAAPGAEGTTEATASRPTWDEPGEPTGPAAGQGAAPSPGERAQTGQWAGPAAGQGAASSPGERSMRSTGSYVVPEESLEFLRTIERVGPPIEYGEASGAEAIEALARASGTSRVLLHATEETGERPRDWYFFLEGGRSLGAYLSPPDPRATLAVLLARQNLLSDETASSVLIKAAAEKISEEAAIAALGVVPDRLLGRAMTAKAKLLKRRLSTVERVRYTVSRLGETEALTLPTVHGVTEKARFEVAVAKYLENTWEEMARVQEDYLALYPRVTGRPDIIGQNLGLSAKVEHFVGACLNGEFQLRDVYKVTGLPRARTFAITFALKDLGVLSFTAEAQVDRRRDAHLEEVDNHFERIGRVDDFEFLNVHWTATQDEIDEALEAIEGALSEDALGSLGSEVQRKARAIVEEARRCHARLDSASRRRAYRDQILEPFELEQAIRLMLSHLDMAIFREDEETIWHLLDQLDELNPNAGDTARERIRRKLPNFGR